MTASVIERRPLYTDQLYGTHMAIFSESCSVAVVHRVTDIYRAVTYWFDYRVFFFLFFLFLFFLFFGLSLSSS